MAAQFIEDGLIAHFSFEQQDRRPAILAEKHYRLVVSDDLSEADLELHRSRAVE